ncbi:MAG: cation transporter [Thermoplasmata archaeon]|nr:MAG: cation transporter [Thermoplasmata archaeon]
MPSLNHRPEKLAGITAVFLIGIGIVQVFLGEFISNSIALTANGIDCMGDGFVSAIVWVGLKYFSRPADHKFHYGYYKLENFATGMAAIVMILLAVYIGYRSYLRFIDPHEVDLPIMGALIALIAGVIALVLGIVKYRQGKKAHLQSARLEAFNTIKDSAASFLAVIAIILAAQGFLLADAVAGFIISIIILSIAFAAIKESSLMLLDACDGQCIDSREVIIAIATDHEEIKAAHMVRVRRTGPVIQGELEIELPEDMTIKDLDRIKSDLHKELKDRIHNIERLTITAVAHKKYKDDKDDRS